MEWGIDDDIKILHIDLDKTTLNKIKSPTLGIHGDLATILPAINAELSAGLNTELNTQTDRSN